MIVLLRIIDGPQAGSSYELHEGQRAILGRGDRSNFRILDSWASRLHCAVTCRPEGILLEDLNTKNGTFVNGKQIEKARLPDGSLIQIGTTTVQVLLRPTQRTVVAPSTFPLRSRAVKVALCLVAGAAAVAAIAFGALFFFGPRSQARKPGGKEVSWSAPKDDGGFRLFGLLPGRATIDITSEPAGAEVFIDDERRGATPLQRLEVGTGEHVLRVQKAGYDVYRAALKVGGSDPEPVHVILKIAERSTLVVRSRPDGASVHLDGEYRGNTPLQIDELEPQTYSVRVSKANFADWNQEVTVKPRETLTVEAVLGHRQVSFYEAELKKDPDNVSYHTEVAHLYLLEQKIEPTIEHLAQAIEVTIAGRDSSRPAPYADRLVLLLQKVYFNDHFTYGEEAFVAKVRGHVDTLLADVAARHPDSSFIHSTAHRLYQRAGTSLRAKAAAFEAKAKAEPAELSHYLNAVGFLILAREYSRAEELLESACKANPDDPQPYMALGRFYLGSRKRGSSSAREKAIQALNAALQRCKSEDAKAQVRQLLGDATR